MNSFTSTHKAHFRSLVIDRRSYRFIQQVDAVLQIRFSCTEKTEELLSDGLFDTQTVIILLWRTEKNSAFMQLIANILLHLKNNNQDII